MTKKKRKLSKSDIRRRDKNWNLTQNIYDEACLELRYTMLDIKKELLHNVINEDEFLEKKNKLDDLYCQKIRQLETSQLEEIVSVYRDGLIKRTQKTIQMILDEIANRAILDT